MATNAQGWIEGASEDELVRANMGLVRTIARRHRGYARKVLGQDLDDEDLESYGMEGLLRAIRGFDPSRGWKLSTYAYTAIGQMIRRRVDERHALGGKAIRAARLKGLTLPRVVSEGGGAAGDGDEDRMSLLDVAAASAATDGAGDELDARAVVARIPELGERDRFVLEAKLRGMTLAQVGAALGMSRRGAQLATTVACDHLRALLRRPRPTTPAAQPARPPAAPKAPAAGGASTALFEVHDPERTRPRFERFVEKLPTGCWIWTGATSRVGRAMRAHFGMGSRACLANRVAYALANGPFDAQLQVTQWCKNTLCMNPAHLLAMSRRQLANRARLEGTQVRGARCHWLTSLTEAEVVNIRQLAAGGATYAAIRAVCGLPKGTIAKIVRGETWKHVGGPRRRRLAVAEIRARSRVANRLAPRARTKGVVVPESVARAG